MSTRAACAQLCVGATSTPSISAPKLTLTLTLTSTPYHSQEYDALGAPDQRSRARRRHLVNAAAPHTAHRALPRGARRQPRWRRRRRGRVATRPRGDAQRCGAQRAKPVKHSPLTLVFKLRDIYEVESVNERSELCRTDRVIAGQTRVKLETSMYVAATNANTTIAFVVNHHASKLTVPFALYHQLPRAHRHIL